MNEIKTADTRNLILSLLSPGRIILYAAALYLSFLVFSGGGIMASIGLGLAVGSTIIYGSSVREDWRKRRFLSQEHRQLWEMASDRLKRFRTAIKHAPEHTTGSLQELPAHTERTAKTLYDSLRRADMVKAEILKSEGTVGVAAMPFNVRTNDPETSELYMLADKNVAEYKRYFDAVTAQVTRTEGQCALFISALDALRVQLLGYRLASKESKSARQDFVGAVDEIKQQLAAIDKALDELDIGVLPVRPEERQQPLE